MGAFRVTSGLLPLYTHPRLGWRLDRLDRSGEVRAALARAGRRARAAGVRLSFHPDQFVVLGSAREAAVELAARELEYLAECAALIGAEQLTVHGGGAEGGKGPALERLRRNLSRVPRARPLLALENDDRIYTVADLLPICVAEGLPLVYDVHHHRLNPDDLSIDEATAAAAATWRGREPWRHLSSPAGGWRAANPRAHADFIAPRDLPPRWLAGPPATLDVEAKAKERALLRLQRWLHGAARAKRSLQSSRKAS